MAHNSNDINPLNNLDVCGCCKCHYFPHDDNTGWCVACEDKYENEQKEIDQYPILCE